MFEALFNTQFHRFNALGSNTTLSEAVSALFPLIDANVDSAQLISILYAAEAEYSNLSPRSSTDDFISAVAYEAVESVAILGDAPAPAHT